MIIYEERYKNFRIEIYEDSDPVNPREWDNLGTIVCWHNKYKLGDEQPKNTTPEGYWIELAYDHCKLTNSDYDEIDHNWAWSDFGFNMLSDKLVQKIQKWIDKTYIILDVYMYDHGNITINTSGFSCPWDSGQIGFIYVSIEDIKKEYGWKYITKNRRAEIANYLKNEVIEYDNYLINNVYGYTIYDHMGEEFDSCWGFYGDYKEHALPEAKSVINFVNKTEAAYA